MKLENECFAVDLAVNMASQNDLLTLALTKQLLNIGIMKNKDNRGEECGKIRSSGSAGGAGAWKRSLDIYKKRIKWLESVCFGTVGQG